MPHIVPAPAFSLPAPGRFPGIAVPRNPARRPGRAGGGCAAGAGREQTGPMRSRRAAVPAPPVLLALALAAGCSTATTPDGPAAAAATSPDPVPTASPAPLSATDWPTYHRDAARTGVAPGGPAAGALSIAWRRHLDGAVYGQP